MLERRVVRLLAAACSAVALCAALAAAQPPMGSIDFLDYKNGFRDAHFGALPAEVPGLGPLTETGELSCGRRPDDRLQIGNAKLSAVEYCFFEGKLARITIIFDTVVDTEIAVEGLREAWGQPLSIVRSPDPSIARRLTWTGDNVRAMLESREHVAQGGVLILMSMSYAGHLKARQDLREQQRQSNFGKDL